MRTNCGRHVFWQRPRRRSWLRQLPAVDVDQCEFVLLAYGLARLLAVQLTPVCDGGLRPIRSGVDT